MKSKLCQTCKTKIEVKNRYEKGRGNKLNYHNPCNTCLNRQAFYLKEIPCGFCIHN